MRVKMDELGLSIGDLFEYVNDENVTEKVYPVLYKFARRANVVNECDLEFDSYAYYTSLRHNNLFTSDKCPQGRDIWMAVSGLERRF